MLELRTRVDTRVVQSLDLKERDLPYIDPYRYTTRIIEDGQVLEEFTSSTLLELGFQHAIHILKAIES